MTRLAAIAIVRAFPALSSCSRSRCSGSQELGNAFLWTEDEQKALESYHEAVERDPGNVGYATVLAGLYLDLGYAAEAERVLTQAKAVAKPNDKDPPRAL